MIRNLSLRGWRSYEELNLQLGPGTTFVVAPNGVGKTSLVYGLAWGVFGHRSNIDPKQCIRAGASMADVCVNLELPDGREFSVSRVARIRGTVTASYRVDGKQCSEISAIALLEEALGIELGVASRLSMMLGGGHLAANNVLELEGHLHHTFGIENLLEAVETAESYAKKTTRDREALRSANRQQLEDRSTLEGDIAEVEVDVARLQEQGSKLRQNRDKAATLRSVAQEQLALANRRERYKQERSELITSITALLGERITSESDEQIMEELHLLLESSKSALSKLDENWVAAHSTASVAAQALELLHDGKDVCPTCKRVMSESESIAAVSANDKQRLDANAEMEHIKEARSVVQARFQTVSRVLAQFEALQGMVIDFESSDVPSPDQAETLFKQAAADLDAHNQRLGAILSRLQDLKAKIATDDQVQEEERILRLAYRREAVALASLSAIRSSASQVIDACIEPLAQEIRNRWKHLFVSNGLTFSSNGLITRLHGDTELPWDTLSGGERTWARIVTHLILMTATSSLPFAWFDEPLEHLDPRMRHAVAATLATATSNGSPRQLLVTTYEHSIAQSLADKIDDVKVLSVRESVSEL